jgi:hypothetical protein
MTFDNMCDRCGDEDSTSGDPDASSEDECNEISFEPDEESNAITCVSDVENPNDCCHLNAVLYMVFSWN